jgi:hypothetical protein
VKRLKLVFFFAFINHQKPESNFKKKNFKKKEKNKFLTMNSIIFFISLIPFVLCSANIGLSINGGSTSTGQVSSGVSTPLIYSYLDYNVNFGNNITFPLSSIPVPVSGFYTLNCDVIYYPPSSGNSEVADNRSLIIYLNGNQLYQKSEAAVNGDQTRMSFSRTVNLNAGDEISINVYQSSGESLYVGGASLQLTL